MNGEAVYYVHKHVIPAAFDLLPGRMGSREAHAFLIAIGLQESGFDFRAQQPKPIAVGYWMFEKGGGVQGVLTHRSTAATIRSVLATLNYVPMAADCYQAIEHNDVLACVFARLLLWTLPGPLPSIAQPERAWLQYMQAWRPGKPHPETWDGHFAEAWRTVIDE